MKKLRGILIFLSAVLLCFIMSISAAAENLEIIPENVEQNMIVGDDTFFTSVRYRDENDYLRYVEYIDEVRSSDPAVAEVKLEESSIPGSRGGPYIYVYAKGAGTATITVVKEEGSWSFPINVYGEGQYGLKGVPGDTVLNFGESLTLTELTYFLGDTEETVTPADYYIESSNESIVRISDDYKSTVCTISPKNAGETTLKVVLTGQEKVYAEFKVTVPEKAGASKPQLPTQLQTCKKAIVLVHDTQINVGINITEKDTEYEIYMSDKKNKGYQKVGWIKLDYFDSVSTFITSSDGVDSLQTTFNPITDVTIKKYKKKKLKPNKKYYVKIRARSMEDNCSKEWSEFSEVREYWTAPSNIAKNKIKYNSSTGKLTVPKVKGAAGYYYGMSSLTHLGYNIFGKRVYLSEDRTAYSAKNSFVTKKISGNDRAEEIDFVYPYAKHNGYYYLDGKFPFKKLKTLNSYKNDKHASSLS